MCLKVWLISKCPIGVNENKSSWILCKTESLIQLRRDILVIAAILSILVHTWIKVIRNYYQMANVLFQQIVSEGRPRWRVVAMLPPCPFRSLALTLSWATTSYGTSCLVCLPCQPFSSVCCSSSVQKAPDTFTSSWMRKPKQSKVSLWWFSFLPIVLELSVNEKQCTWMDTCEIGTSAFQMKSVIIRKNMHDHLIWLVHVSLQP